MAITMPRPEFERGVASRCCLARRCSALVRPFLPLPRHGIVAAFNIPARVALFRGRLVGGLAGSFAATDISLTAGE